MAMSTVISVENVSKLYRLGLIGGGTLRADLERWWAHARGRPDPLLKIGQQDHGNRAGEFIWALRDVSFEVSEGEILGIIGRNGAGKSTLLKILSQVTAPTSGQVKVKGRVASLLQVGTGFHPELTGSENVYLNGAILGMTRAEIDRKFDEIVDFSGVEKFIDTPVKRYSSGMYVRLAFSVAAHLEPEILLVDEVLAVGDFAFQKKCLGKMGDVAREGRTVLFVSHNMATVNNLCQRALLLEGGQIARRGDTHAVVSQYLGAGTKGGERSNLSFPEDPSKRIQLLNVKLVGSNGTPTARVEYYEDFAIEIEFLAREIRAGDYINISVLDSLGNIVFLTSDEDTTDSMQLKDCSPGKHRYRLPMPSRLLKPGKYSTSLGISSRSYTHHEGRVDGCNDLSFEVIDTLSHRGARGLYRAAALVAPEIPWSLGSQE